MDLLNDSKWFTQQVAILARQSPVVQFSACAVAAKQLGQMQDPHSQFRKTRSQHVVANDLTSHGLDFNWYGAKYYGRAIQLLARQISERSVESAHPSPTALYDGTSNAETECEDPGLALSATSILSLYEMLSATVSMKAWTGHLNGFYKLFKSFNSEVFFQDQPMVSNNPVQTDCPSIQASFWYFVMNDLEESCKRFQILPSAIYHALCNLALHLERGHTRADCTLKAPIASYIAFPICPMHAD